MEWSPALPEDDLPALLSRRDSLRAELDDLLSKMSDLNLQIKEAEREKVLKRKEIRGSQRALDASLRTEARQQEKLRKIAAAEEERREAIRLAMTPEIPSTPAVPVAESVTFDGIICLIDGVKRKTLAPYLRSRYGMTPAMYRERFGLPDDYPMSTIGHGNLGRVGVTHRDHAMSRAIMGVLEGIDRRSAVSAVLGRARVPMTTREVTLRILSDYDREVHDSPLLMEVASRIGMELHLMAEKGLVERSGNNYRRQWALARRRSVRRG